SFTAHQSLFAGSLIAARFHKLPKPDRFGADESPLKVGVDLACGVVRRVGAMHRPGAHLVLADREERLQAEKPVAGVNQPVEPRLGDARARQELLALVTG